MKLLTSRLSKVQSRSVLFRMCRRLSHQPIQSTPDETFIYHYDSNELIQNVSVPAKRIWSSFNRSNDFRLKELLDRDTEYRSIISSVILSAKYGILVSFTEENTCQRFFNHITANIEEMPAEDIVSTLIVLNLLNVPLYHPINQKLTIRVINMLKGLYFFANGGLQITKNNFLQYYAYASNIFKFNK